MRLSNEIKAGAVIVAAIAIGVLFFAKTASFKKETYDVKTSFKYAGNLKVDAIVKLTGIEVGRLKSIEFKYGPETKVDCVLEIDKGAKLRKDSIAYIDTAGFVGDAYIGITAGTSGEFLASGAYVESEEPVQMRMIMKKFDAMVNNADSILHNVDTFLIENRGGLDNMLDNFETISENFESLSEDLKKHPWKLMFKGKES